jgi:hypothetical protein
VKNSLLNVLLSELDITTAIIPTSIKTKSKEAQAMKLIIPEINLNELYFLSMLNIVL